MPALFAGLESDSRNSVSVIQLEERLLLSLGGNTKVKKRDLSSILKYADVFKTGLISREDFELIIGYDNEVDELERSIKVKC